MIADIIGWIATIFRGAGMLAKHPDAVKYLVSVGNLCWLVNGFCLVVIIVEIVVKMIKKRKGACTK